jgi:hypothetical protein
MHANQTHVPAILRHAVRTSKAVPYLLWLGVLSAAMSLSASGCYRIITYSKGQERRRLHVPDPKSFSRNTFRAVRRRGKGYDTVS